MSEDWFQKALRIMAGRIDREMMAFSYYTLEKMDCRICLGNN